MDTSLNHVVLARKWRPCSFDQVVGQAHVVKALTYALDHALLHQAYLLTGTRGVGKTTLARIIAKSLNCVSGVSSQPCGHCAACTAIQSGYCVDCVEIDAAMHTRVDDIRDLLDNALYPPAQVRYKVYIIDEVHMLSASAFQALLKTLEEPPPYLQFILATTDPQKMPPAVLSRCLEFTLRALPIPMIMDRLSEIMYAEQIIYEPEALPVLAQAAGGSMRDALSLLDQVRAYGQGRVALSDTQHLLGLVSSEAVYDVLYALGVNLDLSAARVRAHALLDAAVSLDAFLSTLMSVLHQTMLCVTGQLLEQDAPYAALSSALSLAQLQMWYQIALLSRKQSRFAPDEQVALDVCLLRMHACEMSSSPGSGQTASAWPTGSKVTASRSEVPADSSCVVAEQKLPRAACLPDTHADWLALVPQLSLSSGAARLAATLVWTETRLPRAIVLSIDRASYTLLQVFVAPLELALSQHYGISVHLEIVVCEASMPLEGSVVQTKKHRLDRQVEEAQRCLSEDKAWTQLRTLFGLVPDWTTLSGQESL